MPLTDVKIRNAQTKERPYKLYDRRGLFLLVMPNGSKQWRFRYRVAGKENMLSLGAYPEVSLREARHRADEALRLLEQGRDPRGIRRVRGAGLALEGSETLEVVAREWFEKFSPNWVPSHATTILRRLETNVFPWLGARPIEALEAQDLLPVLRRIEERGALETAHRVRTILSQVFRYAVATGRAKRDPLADLKGALSPVRKRHFAALTDPQEVAGLLRAIDTYQGSFVTRCALKLAPLLFVRPGELRQARWEEIDLEQAVWNIPKERVKTRTPHIVPLARQALEILEELKPLTGRSPFVFPSERSYQRPMSENTLLGALRRLGYTKEEMTPHGFRAMGRTMLEEILQVRPEIIEQQLAHRVLDPLGRAYNRTTHLQERRQMMQAWADYLDELKAGGKVIPLRSKG
jgi:integrase